MTTKFDDFQDDKNFELDFCIALNLMRKIPFDKAVIEAKKWVDESNEYDYATCEHGIYKGLVGGYCDKCDEYEEKRGGLDKCLNCGRYKYGDELDKDQCCIKQCKNPNE